MANEIRVRIGLDTKQADTELRGFTNRFRSSIDASTSNVGRLRSSLGGLSSALTAIAGIAAFKQVAQFGIDLDRARNAMTALTGSVENAKKKLSQLRDLAKASPGVTQTFATQLFNQLKAIGGIADETINRVIKSLGKLNAVFSDIGPEFSRNLVQIFQQGFERSDIKEALGRLPIFEQLLERAFGTRDGEKLRKLKAAGKLTLDTFLTGLSTAIDTDPRLRNISESLGGRLAKQIDEVKNKLAPLGEKILQTLIPALDKLIPILSKVLDFFNAMPDALQATTIGLLVAAPAINTVATAVKTLAGSVGALSIAGSGAGFARIVGFFSSPAGIALLGAVGLTASVAGVMEGFERMESDMRQRFDRTPRDLEGKPLFTTQPPAIGDLRDFRGRVGALDPTKPFGFATPLPAPIKPTSGGTGGGKSRVDPAIKKIQDLQRQIEEGRLASFEIVIDDLEKLNEQIRAGSLETDIRQQQLEGRPAKLAGFAAANAERIRQINLETLKLEEATAKKALEELKKIEPILSNSERFMLGFKDATIQVGDAFERLGANIAASFTNIRTLFDSLKRSVLDFFNDILGSALQSLVKNTLGSLFGNLGGSGGGIGSFFSNLFRASSFAGGNGLAAPPSVSLGGLGSLFTGGRSAAAGGLGGLSLDPLTAQQFGLGGGGATSFLGGLGQSFAAAAPLLGLTLGAGLGGPSRVGNILGGAGGLIAGTSVAASLGLITSGPLLAALPFAAPFAIPLLIGSFFLGKAKQRGNDERAAGQMLLQAQEQIRQLQAGIANDSIEGSRARAIFENEILTNFRNQIGTLKTGSVRRSRLSNQVNDLRKFFDNLVLPEITAQDERRRIAASNALTHSKLIPEFATGGVHSRGGLAILHPGEMVLNQLQQHAVIRQSSPQVFDRAGVPGVQQSAQFPHGGIMPSGQASGEPIVIEFAPTFVIGTEDQTKVFVNAGMTAQGRRVIVKQIDNAQREREL